MKLYPPDGGEVGKMVGMGSAPCLRGRTLLVGADGCQERGECIGWNLCNLHPPGDHPHHPHLPLPRLSCPPLDDCSAQHNLTLLLPCCWPRVSTKRCVLGLGVRAQNAMPRPDGDSLGVGCCKAVDGCTVGKPAYDEHGHPTAQAPD